MTKLINYKILSIFTAVLFFGIFYFVFSGDESYNSSTEINDENLSLVTKIIDGDTFQIESGGTIRMICIDTPEEGETGYEEARIYLESILVYQKVLLVKDVSETDDYGRLLRYVYLDDGTFVNQLMVEEGFAQVFPYGDDVELCDEMNGK